MIINRRFFAVRYPDNKSITIDVRTSDAVSDNQALANAEDFAMLKLKAKSLSVTPMDIQSDVNPDYSIGPKASTRKTAKPKAKTASTLRKYLVVSYDSDQQQWFYDTVLAKDEESAGAFVCEMRP